MHLSNVHWSAVSGNKKVIAVCTLLAFSLTGYSIAQVRLPARAGEYYPADKEALANILTTLLDKAKPSGTNADIVGLWVPHAGYSFSAQIAANAFYSVKNRKYDTVIIIASSHQIAFRAASFGDYDSYRTPLGDVPVDRELIKKIKEETELATFLPQAHTLEHSVEVQLPFIQTLLPGTPIVPIVLGQLDSDDCKRLAKAIDKVTRDKNILFIASSDMSHYPSYQDALRVDGQTLQAISDFNIGRLDILNRSMLRENIPGLVCVLCSWPALETVMFLVERRGAKYVDILPYANSGDVSGDKDRVVGYGAAVFHTKEKNIKKGDPLMESINFTPQEKQQLFTIARRSILAAIRKEPIPDFPHPTENLLLKRGVFVTLTNRGRLRGCIGYFDPVYPLGDMVSRMAVAAATQDYRFAFDPVTEKEMDDIHIRISILSEMKKIESVDEIKLGVHGIWVSQGSHSGTFLPEVAKETGWSLTELLEHCCADKAGLPPDAWKKGADIYIYTSQVLDEKDL